MNRATRAKAISLCWYVLAVFCLPGTDAVAGAVMTMQAQDYSMEAHPGPRLGCARCDAMTASMRGFSGEILVPRGCDIRMTRSWMLSAGARNALVLANYSKEPKVGLDRLEAKPQRIVVIYDTPITAGQVLLMHQSEATEGQLTVVRKVNDSMTTRLAAAQEIIDLKTYKTDVNDACRKILAGRKDDELMIILSHVTGGNLRFHDGSEIPMAELESPGTKFVVGCNTLSSLRELGLTGLGLGFGSKLTYDEAPRLVRTMLNQYKFGGNNRDALLLIQNNPKGLDIKEELIKFTSPADFPSRSEEQLMQDERKGATGPAVGIVKADVFGIGVTDSTGQFYTSRDRQVKSHLNQLIANGSSIP